jgi:hypothetical protein
MKPDVKTGELYKAKEAIQNFLLSYSTRMKGPLQSVFNVVSKMDSKVKADELQAVGNSIRHMENLLDDLRQEFEKIIIK